MPMSVAAAAAAEGASPNKAGGAANTPIMVYTNIQMPVPGKKRVSIRIQPIALGEIPGKKRVSVRIQPDEIGEIVLGEMSWIHVCYQRFPQELKKVPVPRGFEQGREGDGKLAVELVHKWLSRVIEREVTSVYIASPTDDPDASKTQWCLKPFSEGNAEKSPFAEGAVVVVCARGQPLDPEVETHVPKMMSLANPCAPRSWTDASQTQVVGRVMGLWSKAKIKTSVAVALARPMRPSADVDQAGLDAEFAVFSGHNNNTNNNNINNNNNNNDNNNNINNNGSGVQPQSPSFRPSAPPSPPPSSWLRALRRPSRDSSAEDTGKAPPSSPTRASRPQAPLEAAPKPLPPCVPGIDVLEAEAPRTRRSQSHSPGNQTLEGEAPWKEALMVTVGRQVKKRTVNFATEVPAPSSDGTTSEQPKGFYFWSSWLCASSSSLGSRRACCRGTEEEADAEGLSDVQRFV